MIDAISSASSNLRRTWDSSLFQSVAIFLRFSRSEQLIGFSFIQSFCAAIMQVIVASFADTRPNVTKSSNVYAAKIERVLMMDLTVGSLFMICVCDVCYLAVSSVAGCQSHKTLQISHFASAGFRQICCSPVLRHQECAFRASHISSSKDATWRISPRQVAVKLSKNTHRFAGSHLPPRATIGTSQVVGNR
jgi:hypothetical protein